MKPFDEQYQIYLRTFETALDALCDGMKYEPAILTESMRYSLRAGGKRIRPVLFFAALDAYGVPYAAETDCALALECIHTYSLIHDDLPAMDNDDFRRGKPSNHKKFGEGNALLAGDALLSLAFDLLLRVCGRGEAHIEAARELSRAAGADGMLAGQSADLLYEGKEAGKAQLDFMVEHKTARLLAAPVVMAACLAGRDTAAARAYGNALGVLFQITDDILDVKGEFAAVGKTLGKDSAEQKLTYIKVYGMEEAERLTDFYAAEAQRALLEFGGETEFLKELVDFVRNRKK